MPRRAIKLGAIMVSALAAAGASPAAANLAAHAAATTTSPWSQTDYNAAQSRANLAETILTRANVAQAVHLRAITIALKPPSQSCSQQVDSVALPGSRMYVAGGGFVAKYAVATGHLLWRRSTGVTSSDLLDSVAFGGGMVVVGGSDCGSSSDPRGSIQAFNARTGALAWTRPVTPDAGALSNMVVSGGLVVSAGFSEGSGPQLSVRRISTGALVWKNERDASCSGRALVVAQVVVTGGDCNAGTQAIIGHRLSTGAKVWQRAGVWKVQRGDASSSAGRHLFVTNPRGTIVSLNPLTGRTQYALPGATAVLAVGSGQAYAACGSDVCAYSTSDGSLRWRVTAGVTPALAAEAGGVLYLDGGVALNTGNGKTLATLWTGRSASSLAISDGRIAAVTGPPPVTKTKVIDLYGLQG
jgi:outer membrane protein assembly factor BamB